MIHNTFVICIESSINTSIDSYSNCQRTSNYNAIITYIALNVKICLNHTIIKMKGPMGFLDSGPQREAIKQYMLYFIIAAFAASKTTAS